MSPPEQITQNQFLRNDLIRAYTYTLPRALNPMRNHHRAAKIRLPKILEALEQKNIKIVFCDKLVELMKILDSISETYFKDCAEIIFNEHERFRSSKHPIELLYGNTGLIRILENVKARTTISPLFDNDSSCVVRIIDLVQELSQYFIHLEKELREGQNDFFINENDEMKTVDQNDEINLNLPNVRNDLFSRISYKTQVKLWKECRFEIINDYIEETTNNRVPIYTDGSFFNDSKKCGCACFLKYTRTSQPRTLFCKWKLVNFYDSFTAELMAIYQALIYVRDNKLRATILTDCKNCTIELHKAAVADDVNSVMREIIELIRDLNVVIVWIPGHCGISGNETVDQLAQQACDIGRPITVYNYWRWLPSPLVPENFHQNLIEQYRNNNTNLELLNFAREQKLKRLLNNVSVHFRNIWIQKVASEAPICALSVEHINAVIGGNINNFPKIYLGDYNAETLFADILECALNNEN